MCAGLGTRMRPLTNTMPKPLVPILGKGSLLRTLEILPPAVTRVIIVVNYLEEQIIAAVGASSQGRPVIYVRQDPLDGTGGCLRQVKAQVPDLSERFLAMYGDDLYAAEDLAALTAHPRALLLLQYTACENDTRDAWNVDAEGHLVSLFRPKAGEQVWVNVGAYALDHTWFETTPVLVPGKTDEWSLPHALPQLLERQLSIIAVPATFWLPIGTPEELKTAEKILGRQ
ncbi:MAG: hypothetical protein RL141_328 [Candidatus Parcubacteria bacterium]